VIGLFKKNKRVTTQEQLKVDLHSHLIPQIDDGVESTEESLEILKELVNLGYQKVITTPHIMSDFFNNSEEKILTGLNSLRSAIRSENIPITIEAAAEYYLDEAFYERISDPKDEFLTFGNNFLLFETSFMNEPFYLKDFIFKITSRGITPVMAHPERYAYIQANYDMIDDLLNRGVLLQININSLDGYYSKEVKRLAERIIDEGKVHFIGSDCHNAKHLSVLKKARERKYYMKALDLPLLNNTLL
ncbi:MAG: CpsB/CapC family capsule biosynthesis tyrosine phosphatase, partial [Bacteroidota bacterium]